jgi:hypothetical protein
VERNPFCRFLPRCRNRVETVAEIDAIVWLSSNKINRVRAQLPRDF